MGVTAATHQHSVWDAVASVGAALGVSMPIFWLGLMLMMTFSVDLRWLPSTGAGTTAQLILPALTLGAASTAIIARQVRSAMLEVLQQDYLRTAEAKGATRWAVVMRHAFRNAVIPIVTVVGLQLGYLLSGTVLTETVFARPGLGRLIVDSIGLARRRGRAVGRDGAVGHVHRRQPRGRRALRVPRSPDPVRLMAVAVPALPAVQTPAARAVRQFARHRAAVAGLAVLVLAVAVSAAAPLLAPYSPIAFDMSQPRAAAVAAPTRSAPTSSAATC